MTWFGHLTEYEYFARDRRPDVLNVGWLGRDPSFPTAIPSEETLDLLWGLCWVVVRQTRGFHLCEFCPHQPTKWCLEASRSGRARALGSAEVRVFSKAGAVYAAPNLIYHYVEAHRYKPPDEFWLALHEGPSPPDEEYLDRLRQLGVDWIAWPRGRNLKMT